MRKPSRRFPNGIEIWTERLPNGRIDYKATRNGRTIGRYRVVTSRERRSGGELGGRGYRDFYGWLRAARGA